MNKEINKAIKELKLNEEIDKVKLEKQLMIWQKEIDKLAEVEIEGDILINPMENNQPKEKSNSEILEKEYLEKNNKFKDEYLEIKVDR